MGSITDIGKLVKQLMEAKDMTWGQIGKTVAMLAVFAAIVVFLLARLSGMTITIKLP